MCRIFLFLMHVILLHIMYLFLCFPVLSSPHGVAEYIGEMPFRKLLVFISKVIFVSIYRYVEMELFAC